MSVFLPGPIEFKPPSDHFVGLPVHEIPKSELAAEQIIAVAPDFLTYARWLSTGRATRFFKEFSALGSLRGGTISGLKILRNPNILAKRGLFEIGKIFGDFDLANLSMRSVHSVVLHPYLADLAIATEQRAFLENWLRGHRRGIWTHRTSAGLSLCAKWGLSPATWIHPSTRHHLSHRLALDTARRADGPFKETQFIELGSPLTLDSTVVSTP